MRGFSLGRIFGFPIKVSVSFLLLLGVVALWSGGLQAIPLVLVAFASVLLHELGHALVARRLGVRIKEIELHFFGGAAKMLDAPRHPRHEIAIAAAGPAVSFALAGVSYLASLPLGSGALGWVALINLGIGVFNLLPALPMDGGRILRAALSLRMGHLPATELAVKVARVFAVGLGLFGLFGLHLQLVALAVLLWVMGSAELRLARFAARASLPFGGWGLWSSAWPEPAFRPAPRGDEPAAPEVEYIPPGRTGLRRGPVRVFVYRA
ncbi:MAG: site-2 protease family protein [Myxococcales bacterium]|nr:site-2 protease family protein [Myxococcales bacterium]